MPSVRYAFALLALVACSAAAQVSPDATVRVRLLAQESPTEVSVEAMSAPIELRADGRLAATLRPGEPVTVTRRNETVRVRGRNVDVDARSVTFAGTGLRLRSGRIERTYLGDLTTSVVDGTLQLVNHVAMQPYVASVVASELGFDVPEAGKAQAVLARTYAARRLGRSGAFDLSDNVGSQVYRGEGVVTPVSRAAARETAGEVLLFRGHLAEATYYSSSGGHTEDNEAVWNGSPVPYLRATADPYDQGSPHDRWTSEPNRSEVLRALTTRFGGHVSGVRVLERTRSGRVLRMALDGGRRATISGSQFRAAVNAALGWRTVKSTKFDLTRQGNRYVITGSGFGHGVGMSQYGAMGQAREGRTYRQILDFYFAGTNVSGRAHGEVFFAQAETSAQPEPSASPTPRVQGATSARRYPTPRRLVRQQAERGIAETAEQTPSASRRTAW